MLVDGSGAVLDAGSFEDATPTLTRDTPGVATLLFGIDKDGDNALSGPEISQSVTIGFHAVGDVLPSSMGTVVGLAGYYSVDGHYLAISDRFVEWNPLFTAIASVRGAVVWTDVSGWGDLANRMASDYDPWYPRGDIRIVGHTQGSVPYVDASVGFGLQSLTPTLVALITQQMPAHARIIIDACGAGAYKAGLQVLANTFGRPIIANRANTYGEGYGESLWVQFDPE